MLRVFTTVILLPSVASIMASMAHGHTHVPVFPVQSFTLPVRMRSGIFFQIYKEAESRANVFAMPRRNSIYGRQVKYTQKPRAMQARLQLPRRSRINGAIAANIRRSREQSKCICSPDFGSPGSAGPFTPSSTGHAPRIRGNNPPAQKYSYYICIHHEK